MERYRFPMLEKALFFRAKGGFYLARCKLNIGSILWSSWIKGGAFFLRAALVSDIFPSHVNVMSLCDLLPVFTSVTDPVKVSQMDPLRVGDKSWGKKWNKLNKFLSETHALCFFTLFKLSHEFLCRHFAVDNFHPRNFDLRAAHQQNQPTN